MPSKKQRSKQKSKKQTKVNKLSSISTDKTMYVMMYSCWLRLLEKEDSEKNVKIFFKIFTEDFDIIKNLIIAGVSDYEKYFDFK
tara:strand:- start:2402 stop:2653 length:252 start_codon:yes stop_codon:yes gene_type:complete